MGCWNGTCALTHLPIVAEENVRGYILIPRHFGYTFEETSDPTLSGGFCYSSGVFHPLTYGIRGKYNDYGSMENIKKSPNNTAILAYVNRLLADKKIEIFPDSHGPESKKSVAKVGTIHDLIHLIGRGLTPFGFCMILESSVQAAIDGVENNSDEYAAKGCSREVINKELNLWADHLLQPHSDKLERLMAQYNIPKLKDTFRNMSAELMRGGSEDQRVEHIFAIDHMEDLIKTKDPKVMQDMGDHIQLHRFMGFTRRAWITQTGAGSQEESYNLHRKLAEHVLRHVESRKQAQLDDVDNDPEEVEHISKYY